MTKIELTQDEVNALLRLMDAGLKNPQSGGISMAGIATVVLQKLQEAGQAAKPNGKALEGEKESLHG